MDADEYITRCRHRTIGDNCPHCENEYEQARAMPDLLTAQEVAEYLRVQKSIFYARIRYLPTFPQAVVFGNGRPKWFAREVTEWAQSQREPA